MSKTFIVMTALLAMAAAGTLATAADPDPSALVGKQAPEFKAADWLNAAQPISIASLKGKVALVEFWATNCVYCRKVTPQLVELNKKYADKDVVIVGLSKEPKEDVETYAKKMGVTYPMGAGSMSAYDYRVPGVPWAFVIDPAGKIVWQGNAQDPEMAKALEAEAAKLKPAEPKPAEPKPAEPKK
jgi:thiol-disulfide isomerase/thioredoxin